MRKWTKAIGSTAAAIGGVAAYDLTQKKHTILRNYPVVGHLRYVLEKVGPELRQYIVSSNDEERPFSRDQRSWIYASSKDQNNYFGFGTDNDVENLDEYVIFKHRTFTNVEHSHAHVADDHVKLPSAKVIGRARGRRHAFRPASVVNISAMSYGSLSGQAIESLNRGAELAGCLHNTGEGGISPFHCKGGDVVMQIGTSYFGCRTKDGDFSLDELKKSLANANVKMLEIKLSQGAKPGLGGMLPGAKVDQIIADVRGIEPGQDCASPARHSAFRDVDSMLDFVEMLADETGLPVGIKSAVGHLDTWHELIDQMSGGSRGVDFITIDGSEGGTGAAPLVFADHVSLPYLLGFTRVYGLFAEAGLTDDITFIGSGKLGLPNSAITAFALGADMINVAREAMFSIGCIQAQKCHTDHCPTGIATQNPRLARGIDPTTKAERCANYIRTLRRDLLKVSEAIGAAHPGLIGTDDLELTTAGMSSVPLAERFGYQPGWGMPSDADRAEIERLMMSQDA